MVFSRNVVTSSVKNSIWRLRVVLHLPQLSHDANRVALASSLLHIRVLHASQYASTTPPRQSAPLTSTLMNTLCCYIKSQQTRYLRHNTIQREEKPTFSSPIVNFPCVSLFFSAKLCSFLIASVCMTVMPNLTLPLVYSWPGYSRHQ